MRQQLGDYVLFPRGFTQAATLQSNLHTQVHIVTLRRLMAEHTRCSLYDIQLRLLPLVAEGEAEKSWPPRDLVVKLIAVRLLRDCYKASSGRCILCKKILDIVLAFVRDSDDTRSIGCANVERELVGEALYVADLLASRDPIELELVLLPLEPSQDESTGIDDGADMGGSSLRQAI